MPNKVARIRWPNPLQIGPTAPNPEASTTGYNRTNVALNPIVLATSYTFHADVALPQGAVVTKLKLFYYRGTAACTVSAELFRNDRAGGASQSMASVVGANTSWSAEEDTTITNPDIDNLSYSYTLTIILNAAVAVTNARFAGAEIHWS